MFGLLRYIYDLPYYSGSSCDDDERWNSLVPHAELYVVAEKYQIQGIQCEICSRLRNRIENSLADGEFPNVDDFIQALRKVVTQASDGNLLRRLMVRICVMNLRELQLVPAFISLLQESGRLGADIIGHQDLECGLLGSWMCTKGCDDEYVPWCSECHKSFDVQSAWSNRHEERWWCRRCESERIPICSTCDEKVEWVERGIMR